MSGVEIRGSRETGAASNSWRIHVENERATCLVHEENFDRLLLGGHHTSDLKINMKNCIKMDDSDVILTYIYCV